MCRASWADPPLLSAARARANGPATSPPHSLSHCQTGPTCHLHRREEHEHYRTLYRIRSKSVVKSRVNRSPPPPYKSPLRRCLSRPKTLTNTRQNRGKREFISDIAAAAFCIVPVSPAPELHPHTPSATPRLRTHLTDLLRRPLLHQGD